MLQVSLWIVLGMISISIFLCFIRIILGPTMLDRVVALDCIGINLIGMIGILMIIQGTMAYVDAILVLGIVVFIGTIALVKFIERGIVIDRDRY